MNIASLRLSLAAAMTLGLRKGVFYRDARLYCLNLLLDYGGGCRARCSYCGLSSDNPASGGDGHFIRVEWPAFEIDRIVSRARERREELERVCVSMVMHPQALEDTLELTEKLAAGLELPVSVLVNPSTTRDGDIAAMREAGADMVSVAVDAATEELFDRHRGRGVGGPHRWQRYWRALEEAAIVFGDGRYGCHLIAGLGESEREMLETVQRVRDMGGRSHLFSFYPERGSRMENEPPCPANRFRRIQLARYLIDYDMVRVGRMSFDERGRVSDFGLEASELDRLVETGKPFMTSGCPGSRHECACNRPFGDGPPGDIRSFPFPLDEGDLQTVKKQLATYRETCDGMGERLFESKG